LKKNFFVFGLGFSGGTSQVGVLFVLLYAAVDANQSANFFAQSFFGH